MVRFHAALFPQKTIAGNTAKERRICQKTYTVYAYCMQHSKQSPPSGTTYKNMVELDEGGDDRYLRKAMFYGYGGPGWGGTFNGYNIKSIM